MGFADEVGALRGRLRLKCGQIEIPSGRDWLAREIYDFTQTLLDILLGETRNHALRTWREGFVLGLNEAICNSIVHAAWEQGTIWVQWRKMADRVIFEVVDEGSQPFNLHTPTSGIRVTDLIGHPLSGRGVGMGYIRKGADRVEVLPIRLSGGGTIQGHKVVFTKFTESP